MKILAIIDKDLSELPANRQTLKELSEKLRSDNFSLETAIITDAELFIETGNPRVSFNGKDLSAFDAVFFRRVGAYKAMASIIGDACDKLSIPFIDSVYRFTRGTGKTDQMFRLAVSDISVPKSYFTTFYTDEKIECAVAFLGLPIVLKDEKGNLGKDVFLMRSKEDLAKHILQTKGKQWILQEFIPNDFDYRILVLGEQAAIGEQRIRKATEEFRNNIHLGAEERFLPTDSIPKNILSLATSAAKTLSTEVAGVDIVVDSKTKHPSIIEVNRCPGFTHGEGSEEINLLSQFIRTLCRKK